MSRTRLFVLGAAIVCLLGTSALEASARHGRRCRQRTACCSSHVVSQCGYQPSSIAYSESMPANYESNPMGCGCGGSTSYAMPNSGSTSGDYLTPEYAPQQSPPPAPPGNAQAPRSNNQQPTPPAQPNPQSRGQATSPSGDGAAL